MEKKSGVMDASASGPRIERFSFGTDGGVGARARIGLLVLESDQTLEAEFRSLTDLPGVATYHARLANDALVTPETLAGMATELPVAARLLPGYLGLKAIGYGCTSASSVLGEDRVAEIIASVHPGVPSSNPLTAAKAALSTLGVRRLGLLTPYSPEVTETMRARFAESGFDATVVGSFHEESDIVVGRIDSDSILKAAVSVGRSSEVDGVFISCTNLRAASVVEAAEAALGKPVTASNHALAWHLLRLAGIDDTPQRAGRLFHAPLAATVRGAPGDGHGRC